MTETAQTLGQLASEPIKETVKEAVRELDEETAREGVDDEAGTSDRESGLLLVGSGLLATGVVIGYVIASHRSRPIHPTDGSNEKTLLDSAGPVRESTFDREPLPGTEAGPRPDSEAASEPTAQA